MRPSADRRARERVRGSTVLLLCATASLLLALQAGRASALSMPHTPRRAVLQQLGAAASAVSLGPLLTVAPAATTPQPIVHHYGLHRDQFGELWLPAAAGTSAARPDRALPVIALLHGGFWQQAYDRRLMDDLAASIARHGRMACWNLEYRRVGQGGAGRRAGCTPGPGGAGGGGGGGAAGDVSRCRGGLGLAALHRGPQVQPGSLSRGRGRTQRGRHARSVGGLAAPAA